jgi:hypothetical protein
MIKIHVADMHKLSGIILRCLPVKQHASLILDKDTIFLLLINFSKLKFWNRIVALLFLAYYKALNSS